MAQSRISAIASSCSESGEDSSSLDSLPNDVVAGILLRLPAQFLHNSASHVSRKWGEISESQCFINSHLLTHLSECEFLIQDANKVQSINARDLKLEETDLGAKFHGRISGSSDGVLLFNKSSGSVMDFYVANPVTMQILKLPSLKSTCMISSHCSNIARVSSTGEIKVIRLGRDSLIGMYKWYVLTLGKEMHWRKISNNAPKECDPASYLSFVQSLSVNGVVYWTNSSWITDPSVFAMDLCHETAYHLKVPGECHGQYWTLVQMGKEICCMNCGKDVEMKVWKLNDLHINEWILIKSIRFSSEISLLRGNFCVPLTWLDLEVLVLSVYVGVRNVVVAYNVNKGECIVLKIDDVARHTIFLHTNSLIRF
ncbi:putative F-box/kelch-repeat protein At1g12870 [Arachis stenosperma]|uniref:putative F-box/kelch-repeat protein At1g12870 n=1 Tax=Arachis stenosperma TaxID=217475 RepID=UPI0025ACE251|nr:putative F-box/kelch-repeat protein At1g12870 [Arachis stenosperma]